MYTKDRAVVVFLLLTYGTLNLVAYITTDFYFSLLCPLGKGFTFRVLIKVLSEYI